MKSEETAISLQELKARLCGYIRTLINSGKYTERSLARVFEMSQPHLHHILKGARRLNAGVADLIMAKLSITIFDLITEEELWNSLDQRNPNWLIEAAKRKPPAKASERKVDPRAPWRENTGGS